jgi:hypothetical protein
MRVMGAITIALLLIVMYAMWGRFVDSLLFHPSPGIDLTPARLGVTGEEVTLITEDNVRIHSFYLPSPGSKRALLFLHGNAGNASHRLPNAAELMQLGCNVLLLEYRGYGNSEGKANEAGTYADAQAGLRHLIDQRGFSENRIIVFGRSLGGAVAVDLAQDRKLAGVILESTFTSVADVARRIGGSLLAYLSGKRFDSVSKISRVRVPLLFFHGDRDKVIDYTLGRRLFDAASEPKHFETIVGAGHNDTVQIGGRPYFEKIRTFLDDVAPESGSNLQE